MLLSDRTAMQIIHSGAGSARSLFGPAGEQIGG
jgi:hypothetical protein